MATTLLTPTGSVLGGLFGFGGSDAAPAAPAPTSGVTSQKSADGEKIVGGSPVAPDWRAAISAAESTSSDASPTSVAQDAVGASGSMPMLQMSASGDAPASTSALTSPSSLTIPGLEMEPSQEGISAVASAATVEATNVSTTAPVVATVLATNVTTPAPVMNEDAIPAPAMNEVDYDVNATVLYKNIESRRWDKALEFLLKECEETILSACSTWVIRKEKNGKLRWRLLPVHGAIMFGAPLEVVESLLEAFPYGARCKDDQGMLPLHLAFRNDAPDNIITELVQADPSTIQVKDRKGRLPIGCALSTGAAKKSRARLVETYSALSVEMEKERSSSSVVGEKDKAADADDIRKSFESSMIDSIKRLKALETDNHQLREETAENAARLAERERSEAELTRKVRDLTKALEAMTRIKRAESARYEKDVKSFKSARDDLLRQMEGPPFVARDHGDGAVRFERAALEETTQDDVLCSSMNNFIENHRLCTGERDDLLRRNGELATLLKRVRADQGEIRVYLTKLEEDHHATAVVRENMMVALAKQEKDAAGLAARECNALRDVLGRQGAEVEDGLQMWGAGAAVQVGPLPHAGQEQMPPPMLGYNVTTAGSSFACEGASFHQDMVPAGSGAQQQQLHRPPSYGSEIPNSQS